MEGEPGPIGLFDGPDSDMSFALKLDDTSKDRCYHGWYDVSGGPLISCGDWGMAVWKKLGEGHNLEDALLYAIQKTTQFGPGDAINNYRIKGPGLTTNIYVSGNN